MIQEQTNGMPKSATEGFTPQAEAAYPDTTSGFGIEAHAIARERAAFDAGRRSRDAEIAELRTELEKFRIANAALETFINADPASSSLVATREAIAGWIVVDKESRKLDWDGELHATESAARQSLEADIRFHDVDWKPFEHYDVLPVLSGVVREVGDVEAEQREKDAVIAERFIPFDPSEDKSGHAWAVHRTATDIAAAIRGGEKND